jgi:hypothetical protein
MLLSRAELPFPKPTARESRKRLLRSYFFGLDSGGTIPATR